MLRFSPFFGRKAIGSTSGHRRCRCWQQIGFEWPWVRGFVPRNRPIRDTTQHYSRVPSRLRRVKHHHGRTNRERDSRP